MKQEIKDRTEEKQKIQNRIDKINQGIVPKGYKQTKVGIIPEDWEIKRLSDINEISTGLTPLRSKLEYFGDDIFWVKTTDLNNSLINNTEEKISHLAFKETSIKMVKPNSILIAMYGGFNQIGRTGLMKIKGTTNQAISSFYVDEVEYHSKFILYYLNNYRYYWKKFAASSRKDPNITKKDVEDFPFIKPKYKEQQKIADVLSTWARAIELKESLIKEKEAQKKSLMQKLILPNEKWNTFKLGEVLLNRSETGYPELELIAVTREKGVIKRDELDRKDTSSANKDRYKLVLPNDIAYNTMRMWQGVSGVSKYRGIVSPAYTVLEPVTDKIDPLFTAYMFKLESIINIFRRYSQGLVKDTLNLKYSNFSKVKLKFPPLSEQKRIAEILSTVDREIELLKELVEELKEEKKGLMQLLLTGIVRVKGDDDE